VFDRVDSLGYSQGVLYPPSADTTAIVTPQPVLLPGIIGSARILCRLRDRTGSALACDLPETPATLRGVAEALLGTLPDGRLLLCGLSFGGLVGWKMAELVPDRVAALVAIGTLPGRSRLPRRVRVSRRVLAVLPDRAARRLYRRRVVRALEAEGVGPEAGLISALPTPAVLRRRLDIIRTWHLRAPPPVPAMWVRGAADREAPWTGDDVRRLLPGVAFRQVPGGHRGVWTHPDAYAALLRTAGALQSPRDV